MPYPDFMNAFPGLDVPYPAEVLECRAIRSDAGLVVFFTFHKDTRLPMHAHLSQWGSVLEGEIELTIGDDTRVYRAGDSYSIPAGVMHGAMVRAGTRAVDVFEEPDRYPLKPAQAG
jgi:quercetin dioxygenase-like cupin family protein